MIPNIYLSKNHIFGNRLAALVVKQNPREQIKVPNKKNIKLKLIKHLKDNPMHIQVWPEIYLK